MVRRIALLALLGFVASQVLSWRLSAEGEAGPRRIRRPGSDFDTWAENLPSLKKGSSQHDDTDCQRGAAFSRLEVEAELARSPRDSDALLRASWLELRDGRAAAAHRLVLGALQGEEVTAQHHVRAAHLYEALVNYSLAEKSHRRARAIDSGSVEPTLSLAGFLARRGRYEEADNEFLRANRYAPGIRTSIERARFLSARPGGTTAAHREWQAVEDYARGEPPARVFRERALLFLREGELGAARDFLARAMSRTNEFRSRHEMAVLFARAEALEGHCWPANTMLRQLAAGLHACSPAASPGPRFRGKSAPRWATQARPCGPASLGPAQLAEHSRGRAAIRAARATLAMQPGVGEAHLILGLDHEVRGRLSAARRSFERAALYAPELIEARRGIVRACELLGDESCRNRHRGYLAIESKMVLVSSAPPSI